MKRKREGGTDDIFLLLTRLLVQRRKVFSIATKTIDGYENPLLSCFHKGKMCDMKWFLATLDRQKGRKKERQLPTFPFNVYSAPSEPMISRSDARFGPVV